MTNLPQEAEEKGEEISLMPDPETSNINRQTSPEFTPSPDLWSAWLSNALCPE